MDFLRRFFLTALLLASSAPLCIGSGSGLNVVVVVNQNSSNSVALGNYYRELRKVPPQNIFRMTGWSGGSNDWTLQQYSDALRTPLNNFLSQRRLTNQVNYVVLSMDIPYRVTYGTDRNSTTSVLYYGFKTNEPTGTGLPPSCSLPSASASAYAGSEAPFRDIGPGISRSNLLATMITGFNFELAKQTVYQGAISDSYYPGYPVYLAKSTDTARNVRYQTYDRAIFDARVEGNNSIVRTNLTLPPGNSPMLGLQTGFYSYNPSSLSFVPGALADNLTSFGGVLFLDTGGQLNILSLLAAGATGSYGTVDEPCAHLGKFPTAETYYYQSRGFNLAESYYQGVTNPYQGLLLGDPLSAPFASPPTIEWNTPGQGQTLAGVASLSLSATAASTRQPVTRLDLYTNGAWMRTLTNIAPAQGNQLSVTIGNRLINYSVGSGASVSSVAAGLTAAINAATAQTKVKAIQRGDRIQLSLTDISQSALPLTAGSALGSSATLTTYASAARGTFLDSAAQGLREFQVQGNPTNKWLLLEITKTNGTLVSVGVTNTTGARLAFVQSLADAVNAHPDLMGADGVVVEDVVESGTRVDFNLKARSPGWRAAQITGDLGAQSGLSVSPTSASKLDWNVEDLYPRNQVFISAGLTDLGVNFGLNTAELGDGYHELSAVATEGSNVRAQERAAINVKVANSALNATIGTVNGQTTVPLGGNLQISVSANDAAVNRIELFGTGGSLGLVTGSQTGTFQVPTTALGLGLHPLYAVVSGPGMSFRTADLGISVGGTEPSMQIAVTAQGQTLTWPAIAGREYTILSSTNLAEPFQPVGTVVATNSTAQWTDPQTGAQSRFYRIRSSP